MIPLIIHHLEARPFVPFDIVTSAGKNYHVASPDHAHLSPKRTMVTVYFDDDGSVTLSALHIAAVEQRSGAAV